MKLTKIRSITAAAIIASFIAVTPSHASLILVNVGGTSETFASGGSITLTEVNNIGLNIGTAYNTKINGFTWNYTYSPTAVNDSVTLSRNVTINGNSATGTFSELATLTITLHGSTQRPFDTDSLTIAGADMDIAPIHIGSSTYKLNFTAYTLNNMHPIDRTGNPANVKPDTSGTVTGDLTADLTLTDITAVPEPSTIVAGALLLLPFGAGAFRSLRKNRA